MPLALVDTDVLSFLFKGSPSSIPYRQALAGTSLIVSFQTFAELSYWTLKRNWGQARIRQLADFLRGVQVVHTSPKLASRWAAVRHLVERQGQVIAIGDAWIAATALELNLPLVTHNARDYRVVAGLRVLSAQDGTL